MTVYVGPVHRRDGEFVADLTADTADELDQAAAALNLPAAGHRRQPSWHHVVSPDKRAGAVRRGAVRVTAEVLAGMLRARGAAATGSPWAGTPRLVLVDGNNLVCRAVHAIAARTPAAELARAGTLGFYGMLRNLLRELGGPVECLLCFDGPDAAAWRRRLEPAYKRHRPADELPKASMDMVRGSLGALGIVGVQHDGEEADDLIATLAALAPERPTIVVTADRDLLQLVSATVRVLNVAGKPGRRLLGTDEVLHAYGVTPDQWPDFRALAGDPSDNIPGLPGVGQRTAARLLAGGRHLEQLRGTGQAGSRFGAAIDRSWEQLATWRALIRLKTAVPLPGHCRPRGVASPTLPPGPLVATMLDRGAPAGTGQAVAVLLERAARLLTARGWTNGAAPPTPGDGRLSLQQALCLAAWPPGADRRDPAAGALAALLAEVDGAHRGDLERWELAAGRRQRHVADLLRAAARRRPASHGGGGGP